MMDRGTIASARLAFAGVGTIPWCAHEAGAVLTGAPATVLCTISRFWAVPR
jgi:CO/xanthine dehydrogenase FAD-binding subunit